MSIRRLLCWDTWSPAGSAVGWVLEPLGNGAFVGGSTLPWGFGTQAHFLFPCCASGQMPLVPASVPLPPPWIILSWNCEPEWTPFLYVAIVMVFYHSGRSKTNTHHFPVSCYMFFLCGVFSVSPSLSVNFGELSVPFPQCLVHTIPVFMGFLRAGSANRGFGFLIV